MAIRKLTNSAYLATNWQDEVESKNFLKRGFYSMDFTELSTYDIPSISATSAVDVNGVIYSVDSTTVPSSTVTASGTCYLYITDTAGVITANISSDAAVWNNLKLGYYFSTSRAIMRCLAFTMYSKSNLQSIINSLITKINGMTTDPGGLALTDIDNSGLFPTTTAGYYTVTQVQSIVDALVLKINGMRLISPDTALTDITTSTGIYPSTTGTIYTDSEIQTLFNNLIGFINGMKTVTMVNLTDINNSGLFPSASIFYQDKELLYSL